MWPHAKRGTRFYGDIDERSPSQLPGQFFDIDDAVIKLWLPEKLLAGVDVLSCDYALSRPAILRWVLFEHVFGRVEFVHLKRRDRGDLKDDVRFMRSYDFTARAQAIRVRFLGKSQDDIKLELPKALKDGLEKLADRCDEPLSAYVRRALARELLSESDYLDWQDETAAAEAQADAQNGPSKRAR